MSSEVEQSAVEASSDAATAETPAERMALQVSIENKGNCLRHIAVTVPEIDIQEIREEVLDELRDKAQVPGFRPGRVPDALLLRRFRTEISADIKQKVLMASLEQISEEYKIEPLGEPRLNLGNLEVPDTGDFHYEFDVEVRPDFELPDFNTITLNRPTGEVTPEEIDAYLANLLDSRAIPEVKDGAAEPGDMIACTITYSWSGGEIPGSTTEQLRLRPVLNFQDAVLEGFDALMTGVRAEETRSATVTISRQSPVVEMRGEQVTVNFAVQTVFRVPEGQIDQDLLTSWDCTSAEDFRDMVTEQMSNQMHYQQRQSLRSQLLDKITASADWDLPEGLVRQQTDNALRREFLEMSQAGFTIQQIRARENQMRQNAIEDTKSALKQHFVLDKLATRENIDPTSEEIEREIAFMALQNGESPRKLRARMVKSGLIENLAAQWRERKAVAGRMERGECGGVPHEPIARNNAESVRAAICGNMKSSLVDDAPAESE
ncbi:MAG: trigger factor [Planctomyces sp.]